jgi:ATP-dependent protease ClpP protease subunit
MDVQTSVRLPASIGAPQISLLGRIDEERLRLLRDGLRDLPDDDDEPVTIELTTLGGDAELGRRAMLEIDLARERLPGRRFAFLGKTVVYSAGVTLMAAFPREDRFLTADAMLLIHCRQLEKEVNLSGPIRSSLPEVRSLCHELETGLMLEEEGFRRLIEGSRVGMDELQEKALYNWYVPAEEAVELGLVAAIV